MVFTDISVHLPPDDEELEGYVEVPNSTRDTFSWTYFEKMVGSAKSFFSLIKDINYKCDDIIIDLT